MTSPLRWKVILMKLLWEKKEWQPVIKDFYGPFAKNLEVKEKELDKKKITETATDEVCEKCNNPMVIKLGRFGKFLACSNYPECKTTKQISSDGKIEEPETTDEKCETCGKDMAIKFGRFGKFLACTDYPKCKSTKQISKGTGAKCNKCDKGEIVEKRSKKGRTFYACDQYPKCENALWSKPTGENCPECKNLLLYAAKGKIKCSDCDFSKDDE